MSIKTAYPGCATLQRGYWLQLQPAVVSRPAGAGKWLCRLRGEASEAAIAEAAEKIAPLVSGGLLAAALIPAGPPSPNFAHKPPIFCLFTGAETEVKVRAAELIREHLEMEPVVWKHDRQAESDWDADGFLAMEDRAGSLLHELDSVPNPSAEWLASRRLRLRQLRAALTECYAGAPYPQRLEMEMGNFQGLIDKITQTLDAHQPEASCA